jgi:hypothetical protein
MTKVSRSLVTSSGLEFVFVSERTNKRHYHHLRFRDSRCGIRVQGVGSTLKVTPLLGVICRYALAIKSMLLSRACCLSRRGRTRVKRIIV